jgi:hypothetical protein
MEELIAMAGVYVARPLAGPGRWGALGALLARESLPSDAAIHAPDELMVQRVVTHFLTTGWSDLLETLLEPRAEQLAPGITDMVRRVLEAHGAEVCEDFEPDPVFIGGAWDSGITVLQAMLDTHHRIEAGQETKLVPILCSLRNEWWQGLAPDLEAAGIGETELDAALKAFVTTLLGGCRAGELRRVESTPHTLLHMEMVGQIFPRGRFIHVVRDGRNVAASLLDRDWIDPATGEKVWCCQDPRSAAQYWVHVVDSIRAQAETVVGRYLEVRYEDLIQHPEAELQRVLAFMGETWDPAVVATVPTLPQKAGIDETAMASFIDEAQTALQSWGYAEEAAVVGK